MRRIVKGACGMVPVRSAAAVVAVTAFSLSFVAPEAEAATARRAKKPAARPSVRLNSVALPDGSGQMRLPAGWRITGANKGMVSAQGPEGTVDLGIWFQVHTPQSAATMYARPALVAPYSEPAQAMRVVSEQV